eukprot:m.183735 g.183735  ORF g.183735 m.183735 type:complete len:1207 (+) comp16659_c0_seq2:192-3812(+)
MDNPDEFVNSILEASTTTQGPAQLPALILPHVGESQVDDVEGSDIYRQPPSPSRIGLPQPSSPLRQHDDIMPTIEVHDYLHVDAALQMGHSGVEEQLQTDISGDVIIAGRVGHGNCINGQYVLLDAIQHDGKEVFRHLQPIPPGFSENSGRYLHLAYYESNDAWAISTQLGSLDVIAYTLGDILNPAHTLMLGRPLWYISSGEGQYEADENVIMYGPRVPEPRMALYKEALSLPIHDNSYEEDLLEELDEADVGSMPLASTPEVVETETSPERRASGSQAVLQYVEDDEEVDNLDLDQQLQDEFARSILQSSLTEEQRLSHPQQTPSTPSAARHASTHGVLTARTPEKFGKTLSSSDKSDQSVSSSTAASDTLAHTLVTAQTTAQGGNHLNFFPARNQSHRSTLHQGAEESRPKKAQSPQQPSQRPDISKETLQSTATSDSTSTSDTRPAQATTPDSSTNAFEKQRTLFKERSNSLGSRPTHSRFRERRSNSVTEVSPRRGEPSEEPSAPRERSNSLRRLGTRLSKSLKRFPGSKRMRQTLSDTKLRFQRLSRKETPGEALIRQIRKFNATEQVKDKLHIVEEFRKTLQRNRSRRDEVSALRTALLDVWRCCISTLPSLPADQWEVYFDVLLNVMTRDEIQIFKAKQDDVEPRGSWVKACCRLIWQTHSYVIEKLSSVISHENMLLFCAKTLAINYFLVPDLAQVIVTAICRATPIASRRSRKIGSLLYEDGVSWVHTLEKFVSVEAKNQFYNIYQLCGVDLTASSDQNPQSCPRVPFYHPHAILTTPKAYHSVMQSFQLECTPDLLDDALWLGHRATGGTWTARFVTETEAGFGFFAVFLEVLVRRAKSLYLTDYFDTKGDQKLGINRKSVFAVVYCPGFLELSACYLRLALTTRYAVKWTPSVATPPNLICSWSDRTAACALAMSISGVFCSTLFHDLMLQTSLTHVADVIALLASFQAFLKCFQHMHGSTLPPDVDINLILDFLQRLFSCHHYVVTLFALRWTYECLDYFHLEHRARITCMLSEQRMLETLLCHWEANVRHLVHNIFFFRLYHPSHSDLQSAFAQSIYSQIEQPQFSPNTYEGVATALFSTEDMAPTVAQLYRTQTAHLQAFVQNIIERHQPNRVPPYSSATMKPTKLRSVLDSVYASETLNKMATTAQEAIKWIKENKPKHNSDNAFPGISVALPPLQNMTSMYSRAKQSRY